jgi:hypothetical protein
VGRSAPRCDDDAVSDDLVFVLLPFITAAALGAGFFAVFRERAAARRSWAERRLVEPDLAAPPRDPVRDRPWWASPWIWLVACAVFLVLGIVVWPGLFGGTFLFLPFVWIWRPRRTPRVDPRSNGHGSKGGSGTFTAP